MPSTRPRTRPTSAINQAAGFQSAFDDYAAWCAKQTVCVLGTDPTKATAVYQSLVRPLLDTPLPLKDGRVLSFDDANTGTVAGAVRRRLLAHAVHRAAQPEQG